MRSSLGCNNNPTTTQFNAAFKKLLLGATNKTRFGNALVANDDSPIMRLPSACSNAVKLVDEYYDLNCDDIEPYLQSFDDRHEFSDDILTYISGFINKKIIFKESCVFCRNFLVNSKIRSTCDIINIKNEGKLTQPDHRINIIIKVTDKIFHQFQLSNNIFVERHLIDKVFLRVLKVLDMKFSKFLSCLDTHVDSLSSETSHRNILIKKIVAAYITLRCRHLSKEKNLSFHCKRICKTF